MPLEDLDAKRPHTGRFTFVLVALVCAALVGTGVYFQEYIRAYFFTPDVDHAGDFLREPPARPEGIPASAPVPTPADYTTAQKGFQYSVSYENGSFNPATLKIKRGETVRVTNNTSEKVTFLHGKTIHALKPSEYWENTFVDGTSQIRVDNAVTSLSVTAE